MTKRVVAKAIVRLPEGPPMASYVKMAVWRNSQKRLEAILRYASMEAAIVTAAEKDNGTANSSSIRRLAISGDA